MRVPAQRMRGCVVRSRLQHLPGQLQCLLRVPRPAVEQAGIGGQCSRQATPCGAGIGVDLQRLAVQGDRTLVVAGLADAGVIRGALQHRVCG